jgi:hypothetical protein
MAISRSTLQSQLKALETQRDETFDTFRRILGAIETITYLIDQDQKNDIIEAKGEDQAVNPPLPFPTVGSDSTIHTEADVPQEPR